jgi:hypothetical protein
MVLGSFPYFVVGKVEGAFDHAVAMTTEEGVSRELTGKSMVVKLNDIVMFYVERKNGEIPSLAEPTAATANPSPKSFAASDRILNRGADPATAMLLARQCEKSLVLSLRPAQVNILGQVFRPIVAGTIRQVRPGYVMLYPATLKMPTAPFHKFPTPLCIPYGQIAEVILVPADTNFPLP